MKRCLLFIPRMGGGGAERVMATIANNLCVDHEVMLVSMTDAESFYTIDSRITFIALGQKINRTNAFTKLITGIWGGTKAFFKLKQQIKKWKPDVMLSFLVEANLISIMLKLLGVKCRIVISERNDPMSRGALNRWFERNFYPKADTVVCQSAAVVDFFKDKHKHKMTVIPNPIASDAIPPRHEGKRRKTVVAVGRLDSQKNFKLLIDAFSELDSKFSEYTLEIYGGGWQEKELQDRIDSLGLSNRIFLMGTRKNVMFYIADAALFVMSSDFEGFPNALVEAMATGLPVISTNFSTGVAKDIIGENNGILVPVGDKTALIEAMTEMLSNEDRWDGISLTNRELLGRFSEEHVIALWNEALGLSKNKKKQKEI